jgi:membrane-associated phospholipid phosphatase
VTLGILAAAVVVTTGSVTLRAVAVAVAAAGVLVIGTSRLYLGVHWFTDVLAGWLLGAAWLALGCAALVLVRRGTPDPALRSRRSGAWGGRAGL